MRFSISRSIQIGAFASLFLGICLIGMEILIYQATNELSVFCSVLGSAVIIYSIVHIILSIINYIFIDDKKIALYHRNKLKKSIEITDVKRLIIWQINFHGAKNDCIIFDDGTFSIKDVANKKLRSRKNIDEKSWIAIEYSDEGFGAIRRLLKDCPIDVIKPDQY